MGDKIPFVCLFFLLFDKKYFLTASSAHAVLNITLLMLYLISRFVKFLLICMLFDKFYQIKSKQTKFWIQLNPIGWNYIKLDKTGFNCFKIYQIALYVLNFESIWKFLEVVLTNMVLTDMVLTNMVLTYMVLTNMVKTNIFWHVLARSLGLTFNLVSYWMH